MRIESKTVKSTNALRDEPKPSKQRRQQQTPSDRQKTHRSLASAGTLPLRIKELIVRTLL